MNIASLSLCYPSPWTPRAGLFVRRRLRAISDVHTVRVINPIPTRIGRPLERNERNDDGPPPVWFVPMPYIPLVSLPFNPTLYARAVAPLLSQWVREGSVDLIDAHFSWPDGVAAAKLARRFDVPYCVTLRGVLGRYARDGGKRRAIIDALDGAAAIIAVSQSLADHAIRLGAPADRITVIPNGVERDVFEPGDRDTARAELNRSPDETMLLTVGHLCRRKGFHRVLAMLPDVIARHPNARYVIVGADAAEGRFESYLRDMVRRLRLEPYVTFTGGLEPPDVARWLQAADLFVLPTTNEGCCNAICEALATGLPVVTTAVGGNAELVKPGCGTIVDANADAAFLQAIFASLDRPTDRSAVARNAGIRTWEMVANDVSYVWANPITTHAGHKLHPVQSIGA